MTYNFSMKRVVCGVGVGRLAISTVFVRINTISSITNRTDRGVNAKWFEIVANRYFPTNSASEEGNYE